MGEIITLGGENVDPSNKLACFIAANSVYVNKEDLGDLLAHTELQPSPADEQMAAWLSAVAASNRPDTES